MAQQVLDRLQQKFGAAMLHTHAQHGNETATVEAAALLEIAAFLRDDPQMAFNMPVDNTAVDFLQVRPDEARFEVIWHFYSVSHKHRLRLKVTVSQDMPSCPSLTPLWPGFNWHERETWDLYGIRFTGHPNLKRVLMYEEFKGHPLRKDYPVDGRQPLIEMRRIRDVPTQRQPPPELLNRP
jgi:NADH-quinone oxidoreductase subunit C